MKNNLEECDYSHLAKENLNLLNNHRSIYLLLFKCFPRDIELILYGIIGHNYCFNFINNILFMMKIIQIWKILEMLNERIYYYKLFELFNSHYSYEHHPIKKPFKTNIFSIPNKNLIKTDIY